MTILAALLLVGAHDRPRQTDWHRVATLADRERLRDWRETWERSLAAARLGDGGATIAADRALFDPDDGLDQPAPPAGAYRCRTVKFERQHLAVEPWSRCRVTDDKRLLRLERLDGTQRFTGLVYPDMTHRAIFLGAASYPGEERPLGYGHAAGRDMIGIVDRIALQRWRLTLPRPAYESQLDMVELVPAN